ALTTQGLEGGIVEEMGNYVTNRAAHNFAKKSV
ncbi:hypothetical protein NVP2058O_001, partial [Vibrio phage 2.058.O._10N.286.46.B8]